MEAEPGKKFRNKFTELLKIVKTVRNILTT